MIQRFRSLSSLFIFAFLILGCGKSLPGLEGINLADWKEDQHACKGIRTNMIESFRDQKDKLLGLSEMQIIKLLGKPDENELYKRNQKFYHYYLEPSSHCNPSDTNSLRLNLRFNAMGLAKEVAIE